MASQKLLLEDIVNLSNETTATNKMNANSGKIEGAIERALFRDGTDPNAMLANLDMNGHRILNLPEPTFATDVVRLQDMVDGLEFQLSQDASDIAFVPYSTISSTNIQDAMEEIIDEVGTPAASGITVTPAGNIASTNVQDALEELDTEKQPLDGDLTAIAALTPSNDDVLQRKAGVWTNRTIAQLLTDLGLGAIYQPLDSDLTSIAALSTTSFGRGLLTEASATSLRTTINVENGATADQSAAEVPFTPAGAIAATNVQTAIEELDTEKLASSSYTAAVS